MLTKFSSASVIIDKYKEDNNAPTVANRFADMICQFEANSEKLREDDQCIFDLQDNIYSEDEQEDPENSDEDYSSEEDLNENATEEDKITYHKLMNFKKELNKVSRLNFSELCKCSLTRQAGSLLDVVDNVTKLFFESECLRRKIGEFRKQSDDVIEQIREAYKGKPDCDHKVGEMSMFLKSLFEKSKNPRALSDTLPKERNKIAANLEKLIVAPGEAGKWKNWGKDLYLEEKLFPHLFPYGIGGYLSSNLLKKSNLGFSNYVKSRLMSVNPKFRNDEFYVFFLLLVKESVDIQRSEQTVFRKATKVPNLNATFAQETTKEFLKRYNNAFATFKTIRGTAMYYQDIKKKLLAFIRQKGAPTLFCTFSAAEFDWNELVHRIYETTTKKKVSLEFIESQTPAWKNKLLSKNVVQSTIHFSKRTDKLMSLLQKSGVFEHNGVPYKVVSYFYRVEFQARGAPHIHVMFELRGPNGEIPPKLDSEDNGDQGNLHKKIASFGEALICGSSKDIHCKSHEAFEVDCDNCGELSKLVEKYQTHHHKQSCLKRKRVMRISAKEGHGRFDGEKEGIEILVPVCRYNFPKNPIDKTEFITSFPKDYDPKELKKAKDDYAKIRKYLLRLTHEKDCQTEEAWSNFCLMDFYEFLYEIGMLEKPAQLSNDEEKASARNR